MSYMDYSSAHSVVKSGQRAFLMGIADVIHWDNGWLKQSKITCKGVQLADGEYTGCTQTNGDCPICGK